MMEMVGMMFGITCISLYTFTIQLWLTPEKCLPTLLNSAIYFYFFIVIYSLYRAFRKEYEHQLIQQLKDSA